MKRLYRVLLAVLILAFWTPNAQTTQREIATDSVAASRDSVNVHIYWSLTCPHCKRALEFLERTVPTMNGVALRSHELNGRTDREVAFTALSLYFDNIPPAVPLIIIGDQAFIGYRDDWTSGTEISEKIRTCVAQGCKDRVPEILAAARSRDEGQQSHQSAHKPVSAPRPERPALPETVSLFGFAEFKTSTLSLPALTIALGAVDGFNPCAMWVLVFLIGLLIGLEDRLRIWTYGSVFLLVSGAVYFAFMAAWLNVFLLLGSINWIRVTVGVFALCAGGYYLSEFIRNPDAACRVGTPGEKQKTMNRLKRVINERSFLSAIAGIIVLAVAVNMVELLCSAGIPAIYTQVLALNDLSPAAYFGYLSLYIFVFMLDDAIIFVTAMLTLQATGLAASYSRWSHLVGGLILLTIGALLIAKPDWLAVM
jgi:glutaredoxin